MRLDPEALSRFGFSQTLVEDIRMGYEYALSCTPPEFEKRNYLSFTENAAPARADIDRLLEAGFIEGPLPYKPHLVTPLGMIVKPGYTPGTTKYRIVVDSTATGLNEVCEDTFTKLDHVKDLLRALHPGSRISKFDLSDAFLLFPIEASQAEFLGFRDADGDYYRYRFAPFGVAS